MAKSQETKFDIHKDNWLQDWARAMILAQVSKFARKTNHWARNTKKQLDGESLIKFTRDKYGISLSESMFKTLRRVILEILETYSMHDDNGNTSV